MEYGVFVKSLICYHGTSIYPYTLDIEEAQTNVCLKHECTKKPAFRKNENYIDYIRRFSKTQINSLSSGIQTIF